MSLTETIPHQFKIHIHGFSTESLEVAILVQKTYLNNIVFRSFMRNIQVYLTRHLNLPEHNFYINFGVLSIGRIPSLHAAPGVESCAESGTPSHRNCLQRDRFASESPGSVGHSLLSRNRSADERVAENNRPSQSGQLRDDWVSIRADSAAKPKEFFE